MNLLAGTISLFLGLSPLNSNVASLPSEYNKIADTSFNQFNIHVIECDMTVLSKNKELKDDDVTSGLDTIKTHQGDDFKLTDYINIESANSDVRLLCYGDYDLNKDGSYIVKLVAIDKNGNSTSKEVEILVLEKRPVYDTVSKKKVFSNSPVDEDAYALALTFIGKEGYCTDIANAFLASYYGDDSNCFNTYAIDPSEAKAGDIIYYADGGLGIQHYGIYLGGNTALQGNFNGVAAIKNVYIKNASEPQFFRCIAH